MQSSFSGRWLVVVALVVGLGGLYGMRAEGQGPTTVHLPVTLLYPTPTATATPTPLPTATPSPTLTPTPAPPPAGERHPNDSDYWPAQWALRQIRAPGGWAITTGEPMIVAVLDSGIDFTHPDFVGQLVDSSLWRDYTDSEHWVMDRLGHGTHVSGIAAAASDNGRGVAGVAWRAKILPLKVLDDFGAGSSWDVALAIRDATDSGARVINMSLGAQTESTLVRNAITYARARGVVLVASAGNCHLGGTACGGVPDRPSYPAASEGVIAVAATTVDDGHAPYSNVAAYVDVAAPGGQGPTTATRVWSTLPGGGYGGLSGTSMAAPHVTGLAALVLSVAPYLTPDEVACVLASGADDLGTPGRDDSFGWGRIDARAALERAWYGETSCPAAVAAAAVAATPLPATACDLPHAPDRLLLRRDAAALMETLVGGQPVPLGELEDWQLLAVPDGDACTLVHALNAAAGETVAELDLTFWGDGGTEE